MPGFKAAEDAIEARLKSLWTRDTSSSDPRVKLVFQNKDRELPSGPYLHVMVIGEKEEIAAFGGGVGRNEWDVDGRIEIRAFVPLWSGATLARTLRDEAAAIFRGQRFGNVTCYGASPLGQDGDADRGNTYFVTLVVDFIYRHTG